MALIDALNNKELRDMIEGIDDLWVSLDRGERNDATLERLLDNAVRELLKHGVSYDPRKA